MAKQDDQLGNAMSDEIHAAEEVESRGTAIYEGEIRHLVEPGEIGKFVVAAVHVNDYELDERDGAAASRLLKRRPGAMTWAVRVGYSTAYRWTRLNPRSHD